MARPRIPLYYRDHPRAKYRIIGPAADIGRPSCSIPKKYLSGCLPRKTYFSQPISPFNDSDYFQSAGAHVGGHAP